MNSNLTKFSFLCLLTGATIATLGCEKSSSNSASNSPMASTGTTYTQVERLARPAINEGLIYTNANLNLWNSVGPALDLSPAGSGIVTEAGGVLGLIKAAYTGGAPTANVVSGFLPDVMRIDTTKTFTGQESSYTAVTAKTAYAGCVSATKYILCGGRKLRDNTVQITLSYLAAGNFTGVTYDPSTGTPSQAPKSLLTTGFPYEAAPY